MFFECLNYNIEVIYRIYMYMSDYVHAAVTGGRAYMHYASLLKADLCQRTIYLISIAYVDGLVA